MSINQLLSRYETIYLNFEPCEEKHLRNRLISLGFEVPENLKCPVKIHRDRTISFITGFNEGMLCSMDRHFKKIFPNCIKTDYKRLSGEDIESAWYKNRNR